MSEVSFEDQAQLDSMEEDSTSTDLALPSTTGQTGLLREVVWTWDGAELEVEAPVGATTVTVDDPTQYSLDRPVWVGAQGPFTLTAIDLDTRVLTLSSPLTEIVEISETVGLDAGGTPARTWTAEVDLTDSETTVQVPMTVHDLGVIPEGTYDPPKPVLLSSDLSRIIDLPGSDPQLSGDFAQPGSFPDPTVPTEPPASSPNITVKAFTRSLNVTAQPTNSLYTQLRYEVSNNATFTPGSTVLSVTTASTFVNLSPVPAGVDLWVRVIAFNDLGEAAPSPVVGPVKTLLLEAFDLEDFTLTAKKFQTSEHLIHPSLTLTSNSPSAGRVAWAAFSIVYKGVEYPVAAGNTDQKWVWWKFNPGGTPAIVTGASVPQTLTADDVVLINNASGIGINVQGTSLMNGELLVNGSVLAKHLLAGTITADSGVIADAAITNAMITALSADKIETGEMTAAIAVLGQLTTGGGLIEFSPPTVVAGRNIGGIIIKNPANPSGDPLVQLHPNGSVFQGKLYADILTVLQNLLINGNASLSSGGTFTVKNGISDPAEAPMVASGSLEAQSWPDVPSGYTMRGMCWDATGGRWLRLLFNTSNRRAYIQPISTTGSASPVTLLANPSGNEIPTFPVGTVRDTYGVATDGTRVFWVCRYTDTTGVWCEALMASTISTGAQAGNDLFYISDGAPVGKSQMTVAGGKLFLWDCSLSGATNSYVNRHTIPSMSLEDSAGFSTEPPEWDTSSMTAAGMSIDTDLGATTLVLSFAGVAYPFTNFNRTTLASMNYDASKQFSYGGGYLEYRPSVGFHSQQTGQPLQRWSSYYPVSGDTYWTFRYADKTSGGTTKVSPAFVTTIGKRHFATVTAQPAPAGITGWDLWVGYGSTNAAAGTVYKRAEVPSGRVVNLTAGKQTTGSTTVPPTNTLGGTPAILKAEAGGFQVDGASQGRWPEMTQPHFRAEHSSGANVGTSSENAISWGSVQDNTSTTPNPTAGQPNLVDFTLSNAERDITVRNAGTYSINCIAGYSGNNTGVRYAYIYVNNVLEGVANIDSASTNITVRCAVGLSIKLAAGDVVSIRGWQNSTVTLTFLTGPSTMVSITRIAA